MIKSIVGVLGALLLFSVSGFGQAEGDFNLDYLSVNPAVGGVKNLKVPQNIKTLRVFVSDRGVRKMDPFSLEKVVLFSQGVVEDVTYKYNRSLLGNDTVVTQQKYVYDAQGNLVRYSRRVNKEFMQDVEYEMGENGAIVKMLFYGPNGELQKVTDLIKNPESASPRRHLVPKISTSYDTISDGYKTVDITDQGQILKEKRILLDEKKQIKQIVATSDGINNVSISNFTYDEAGNEISQTVLDRAGKVIIKYDYRYDDQGLLTKTTWAEKKDRIIKIFRYEYEFY